MKKFYCVYYRKSRRHNWVKLATSNTIEHHEFIKKIAIRDVKGDKRWNVAGQVGTLQFTPGNEYWLHELWDMDILPKNTKLLTIIYDAGESNETGT